MLFCGGALLHLCGIVFIRNINPVVTWIIKDFCHSVFSRLGKKEGEFTMNRKPRFAETEIENEQKQEFGWENKSTM